jgi:hypothetical protein
MAPEVEGLVPLLWSGRGGELTAPPDAERGGEVAGKLILV